MRTKQFKAESKRLLDLMINSIYTHKEIFLREIISNASDACDKLCYQALTDDSVKLTRKDFKIELSVDKDARTITVADNGIGMDKDEMENNLGTICRSGSLQFKQALDKVINECNQYGNFLSQVFTITNVKELSAEEVEEIIKKNGGNSQASH